MRTWFADLDRVLRGEAMGERLSDADPVAASAARLAAVDWLLGVAYGFCMGFFGLFNRDAPDVRLLLAAMLKVPALFFLTLAVTFPSLYVFNALVGSRLSLPALARLMAATLGVLMAVLASFGPIVAFFSVTTTSYPFVLLLNVAVFALSGLLGMRFLLRTLYRLGAALAPPADVPTPADGVTTPTAGTGRGAADRVRAVFACWAVVFGVVGAQMSWVLRPFVGHPDLPFSWFRPRESSFFEAVFRTAHQLLSGT
jgi:hypothetical protein